MSDYFSEVFQRDNHRCVYCGRDLLVDFDTFMICEEDHLQPLSKGGQHQPDNIVTACAICNRLKGSYKPEFDLTDGNRTEYIADIRSKIMAQRAKHMNTFVEWTHPRS